MGVFWGMMKGDSGGMCDIMLPNHCSCVQAANRIDNCKIKCGNSLLTSKCFMTGFNWCQMTDKGNDNGSCSLHIVSIVHFIIWWT